QDRQRRSDLANHQRCDAGRARRDRLSAARRHSGPLWEHLSAAREGRRVLGSDSLDRDDCDLSAARARPLAARVARRRGDALMPGSRRGSGPPRARPPVTQREALPARREREPTSAPQPRERPRIDEAATRLVEISGEAFSLALQLRAADELPPAIDLERKITGMLDGIK